MPHVDMHAHSGARPARAARPEPSFRREAAPNLPGQITSSRNSRGPVSQGDRPRPELMAIHELELDALAQTREQRRPVSGKTGCTRNSYSSISPRSANAGGGGTPPTKQALAWLRTDSNCRKAAPRLCLNGARQAESQFVPGEIDAITDDHRSRGSHGVARGFAWFLVGPLRAGPGEGSVSRLCNSDATCPRRCDDEHHVGRGGAHLLAADPRRVRRHEPGAGGVRDPRLG